MGGTCHGKTTYALSPLFRDFVYCNPIAYEATRDFYSLVSDSIFEGNSIIIDDENPTVAARKEYIDLIKQSTRISKLDYIVECHCLHPVLKDCLKFGNRRHSMGGQRINKTKLIRYRSTRAIATINEGFDVVITVSGEDYFNNSHEQAIFVNLDCFVEPSSLLNVNDSDNVTLNSKIVSYVELRWAKGENVICYIPKYITSQSTPEKIMAKSLAILKKIPFPIDDIIYEDGLTGDSLYESLKSEILNRNISASDSHLLSCYSTDIALAEAIRCKTYISCNIINKQKKFDISKITSDIEQSLYNSDH